MPPDRPESSAMKTEPGTADIKKEILSIKEESNPDPLVESCEGNNLFDKNDQPDDDLTPLSWLHQQNLLKGLDISNSSKDDTKNDNLLNNNNNNNNASNDGIDFSENTDSISSLDDNYSESDKTNTSSPQYEQQINRNSQETLQESLRSHYGTTQTKISLSNNNNIPMSNRNKHPTHIPYDPHLHRNSKPPYSFSCLIFMAIEDSPVKALPVKEVYAWILEHFPYFRNAPTGWKNSVRHNLSLNKCFRKVEKASNLGKGSLWMVDAQYRPNLIQALSRAPFSPPTVQTYSSYEKDAKKNFNTRLPDPVLFPYLSKRLASSNIVGDSPENEVDSDVDAAAAAMLSFKHGPIILNHNKDRKRKLLESEKLVPVITRSSSEDHTYSCITSIRLESQQNGESGADIDEQRKIAEGADALLNLAGVSTALNLNRTNHLIDTTTTTTMTEVTSKTKKRSTSSSNDYSNPPEKRRKRWRDWGDRGRCFKQIRG